MLEEIALDHFWGRKKAVNMKINTLIGEQNSLE